MAQSLLSEREMSYKNPEDMTLDEIREQLAIYNRLYFTLRKDDEAYMQKTRCWIETRAEEANKEYVQTHNINQEDLTEKQITEIMNDKKPSGRERGGTIKYDMVNCKIVMPLTDDNTK